MRGAGGAVTQYKNFEMCLQTGTANFSVNPIALY